MAPERSLAGASQHDAGPESQLVVTAAELRVEPVGLLEVVADDLVVTGELAVSRLEPVGEALVQPRAQLLRHRRVRDVADQDVVEPKAVVAREQRAIGADELLARKREQSAAHAGSVSARAAR